MRACWNARCRVALTTDLQSVVSSWRLALEDRAAEAVVEDVGAALELA